MSSVGVIFNYIDYVFSQHRTLCTSSMLLRTWMKMLFIRLVYTLLKNLHLAWRYYLWKNIFAYLDDLVMFFVSLELLCWWVLLHTWPHCIARWPIVRLHCMHRAERCGLLLPMFCVFWDISVMSDVIVSCAELNRLRCLLRRGFRLPKDPWGITFIKCGPGSLQRKDNFGGRLSVCCEVALTLH